ncbi:hypothetical protein AB0P21_06150 [Kribbella sp. NPDC056861]|uniref:hypothetical protein n=1 Tax=Kribbella sp. NPDC056861 TaxID=3154857 RepID=UPI0034450AB8
MRTEEDLRTAFDHLADSAPAADDILAALPPATKPVRRSRTPLVLGAALATAAALIGGSLLVDHLKPSEQAADQFTAADWTPWLTVPAPQQMRVNPFVSTPNRQTWELTKIAGSGSGGCLVSAHRNGDFDPETIPADSPTVDVNGAKGRIITSAKIDPLLPPLKGSYTLQSPAQPGQTIAWQPARGLWALVACQTNGGGTGEPHSLWKSDLPKATELARAVSTGERLAAPYKIEVLPGGLKPEQVSYWSPEGETAGTGRRFLTLWSDGNPKTGDPQRGTDVKIWYETSPAGISMSGFKPDATINGLNAWYLNLYNGPSDPGNPTVALPITGNGPTELIHLEGAGFALTVQSLSRTVKLADLVAIARKIQLAPSATDLSTWYDAATAIPAPR